MHACMPHHAACRHALLRTGRRSRAGRPRRRPRTLGRCLFLLWRFLLVRNGERGEHHARLGLRQAEAQLGRGHRPSCCAAARRGGGCADRPASVLAQARAAADGGAGGALARLLRCVPRRLPGARGVRAAAGAAGGTAAARRRRAALPGLHGRRRAAARQRRVPGGGGAALRAHALARRRLRAARAHDCAFVPACAAPPCAAPAARRRHAGATWRALARPRARRIQRALHAAAPAPADAFSAGRA